MSRIGGVNVQELLARLGLKAERRGREWWAPCPFHANGQERTASFRVHEEPAREEKHARYQCFGACEVRGGSAVGLVMRLLGLDREGAWAWIGGDEAPPPPLEVEVEVRRHAEPFRLPSGVILGPLGSWVTPARRFAEGRGLTHEQVERWRLGYAVEGRLGGRLVLPVRGSNGKLLSYTGRTYVGGTKKWLEPKAEEGGDKGSIFGEERWPPVGERKRVVVVEAALDALAVERVVPGSVGAVYGSQLLPGHAARLSTFAEVVVASDPDGAGEKLAEQIATSLGRWCVVRRVALPGGHDANSLERESPEALRAVLG